MSEIKKRRPRDQPLTKRERQYLEDVGYMTTLIKEYQEQAIATVKKRRKRIMYLRDRGITLVAIAAAMGTSENVVHKAIKATNEAPE